MLVISKLELMALQDWHQWQAMESTQKAYMHTPCQAISPFTLNKQCC